MNSAEMTPDQIATEKYEQLGLPRIPMRTPIPEIDQSTLTRKIPRCPACGLMNLTANASLIKAHDEINDMMQEAQRLRADNVRMAGHLAAIPRWIRWFYGYL